MCPTPIGRVHTRVATLFLPAVVATIASIVTGKPDWIVLIGVYLLIGVALDSGVYSWLLRYQPPWMTFVLALGEFGLVYLASSLLKLNLTTGEAVGLYWVSWVLAASTKVVLLPLLSLTYLESSLEFRRPQWSVPPAQAPLPILAVTTGKEAEAGPLVRGASGEHAIPIERLPGPSGTFDVRQARTPA